MKIGIVGYGFVGKATGLLVDKKNLLVFDLDKTLCQPNGLDIKDLNQACLVFVAVPTPMKDTGECHLGIVESVVGDLVQAGIPKHKIVLRSTVPPGTSDRLGVNFMPEFLTEANWENDFRTCKDWVIGSCKEYESYIETTFNALLSKAVLSKRIIHNTIHSIRNTEAEMCKYARNTYLAVKVSYFNELEQFCRLKGIDYDTLRKLTGLDTRIGTSHTQVPGPDGLRGFGGTCFPKDTNALLYEMGKVNMKSYVLHGAITRNLNVDRPEKDWEKKKGRAVVSDNDSNT